MKTQKSMLNFLVNSLSLPITAILGIILTQMTIQSYGSDINGLNVVITQIITVILVLEGGLGVALNAILYKPYVDQHTRHIKEILVAAKNVFRIIGVAFSIVAFIIALLLPKLLNSELDAQLITILFFMALLPTSLYLYFSLKYKALYDVSQSEYIISGINIITNTLGQIFAIISIYLQCEITVVRFWIMFFLVLRSILIWWNSQKRYPEYRFNNEKKDYSFLKSMPTVISIKVTSLIYGTAPVLYISFALGTMVTSVYSIYSMIFGLIKTFIYALVNAPINAFGQLMSEKDKFNDTREKFLMYEILTIMFLMILLTTCIIVILPFIELFTRGVTDINYIDPTIALLLFLITFFEIVHIPSGILMQVTGKFKENKVMQYITTIFLLISMFALANNFSLYGVLLANVLGNIVLAFLEIRFTHKQILNEGLLLIYKSMGINLLISFLLIYTIKQFVVIDNYVSFIITSGLLLITTGILFYIVNFLFFKSYIIQANILIMRIIKRISINRKR